MSRTCWTWCWTPCSSWTWWLEFPSWLFQLCCRSQTADPHLGWRREFLRELVKGTDRRIVSDSGGEEQSWFKNISILLQDFWSPSLTFCHSRWFPSSPPSPLISSGLPPPPGKPLVLPGSFGKTYAILGKSRSRARSKIFRMAIAIIMTLLLR